MGDTCMGLLFILLSFRERLRCHPTLKQKLTDFYHAANKWCFQGHPSTETGIFRWASLTRKTVPQTWQSECSFLSAHCQPHAGSGDPASFASSSSCCLFCHCCFSPLVWIPLLCLVPCDCVCEHVVAFLQRSLTGESLQLEDLNSSFSAVLFRKTPPAVSYEQLTGSGARRPV